MRGDAPGLAGLMAPDDDIHGSDRSHSSAPVGERGVARLGRYMVLGTLARGGMGEVLRARAVGAAGATKEVCIKRIRASRLEHRGAVERFVHEARLSLSLTHANIVSTFDFGRADGDYYLAMEWIDGADLARIARAAADEKLSSASVAHVGAEIARALRYAHDGAGEGRPAIVHCDVKPSNILVSRSGDVKLADFGVAVAHLEGSRGGTPRYMSPEVRNGGAAGPPADLFALGVVLTELLACARDTMPELEALAKRLVDDEPSDRPSAAEVVDTLEPLVARARAAGSGSPRDDLGARAARAAPGLDDEPSELLADASYLRDGGSSIETRLTVTTRSTPEPPQAAASPWSRNAGLALAGLVVVSAIAVGVVQRSARPTGELALTSPPPPHSADAAEAARAASAPTAAPEPTAIALPSERVVPPPPPGRTEPGPQVQSTAPSGTGVAAVTNAQPSSREATTQRGRPSAPAPAPAPVPSPPPTSLERPDTQPAIEDQEPATLRINAIPWANVELDGRALGPTPLTHVELAPGSHTILLTNPVLGRSRTERLEVQAGERRDVIVEMR